MSENKWTEGPWRVGACGPNGCHTVGTTQGLMTAMVTHSINQNEQKDQAVGDAHLISAAPELYDAIEWALAVFSPDTPEHAAVLESMRAALAKARGEQ